MYGIVIQLSIALDGRWKRIKLNDLFDSVACGAPWDPETRLPPRGKHSIEHELFMADSELIAYEEMLQAGMHFGRKRTVFNPKMGKYVYSVRDGICLIDLLKTQEALGVSIAALSEVLQGGGLALFVAPTKQAQETIRELADATNMPYVLDRWIGGTLTNFKNINSRVKRLIQLEEEKAAGVWEKFTKKEQLDLDREMAEMKRNFEGLKKLTRMPDVVFVASVKEGALPIHEAKKMGVKIIAIANTDGNPAGLLSVIPANDRSKKSVDLIIRAITKNVDVQPKA